MDNACILGAGTVGKATAEALGITKIYSRHGGNITLKQASECRYIFVCLPTPTINGECFTKDIYEIIKQISEYPRHTDNIFIIRSTVYPGFNRYLQSTLGIDNIVSNPEFLSEDTAVEDAKNPDIIVIGSESTRYLEAVAALYKGRFKFPQPEFILTDSITAELIKYSLNVFFAIKVMFANAIFDYAQKTGANYETIKGVLEYHRWGSKNHFKPWYKGKRGLHGKCLPKDLEAFSKLTGSLIFSAMLQENEKIKSLIQ